MSALGLDPGYADLPMPSLTRDESDDEEPRVHSPTRAAKAPRRLATKAKHVAAHPAVSAEEQSSVALPAIPTSKLLPTSYSIPVPTSALAEPRDGQVLYTTQRHGVTDPPDVTDLLPEDLRFASAPQQATPLSACQDMSEQVFTTSIMQQVVTKDPKERAALQRLLSRFQGAFASTLRDIETPAAQCS